MVVGLNDVTFSAVAPKLTTGRRSPKFLPEMDIVLAKSSTCALSITTESGEELSRSASRRAGKQNTSMSTGIGTERVTVLIESIFLGSKIIEQNVGKARIHLRPQRKRAERALG